MSGKEARLAHLEARADEFDELIGRHAARFASFFELFDEMRGASRAADGRIDNLQNRLEEVETAIDDIRGPEFTDGSPDLPPVAERRTLYRVAGARPRRPGGQAMSGEAPKLYRVMSALASPLLFDPAAAVRDATNGRDGLVNLYLIEHDPIVKSGEVVGWRPVGSHYFRSAGDGQYSYRSSTGGLTPPDLGDLEVPF